MKINDLYEAYYAQSKESFTFKLKNFEYWWSKIKNPSPEQTQFYNDMVAGKTPSEASQLSMVKKNSKSLEFLLRAGVVPSEDVQIKAVTKAGNSVEFLCRAGITPSKDVQIAAIKSSTTAAQMIQMYNMPIVDECKLYLILNLEYATWNEAAIYGSLKSLEIPKTPYFVNNILTNQSFIHKEKFYKDTVRYFFNDNAILTNKWLRYAETIRNEN